MLASDRLGSHIHENGAQIILLRRTTILDKISVSATCGALRRENLNITQENDKWGGVEVTEPREDFRIRCNEKTLNTTKKRSERRESLGEQFEQNNGG